MRLFARMRILVPSRIYNPVVARKFSTTWVNASAFSRGDPCPAFHHRERGAHGCEAVGSEVLARRGLLHGRGVFGREVLQPDGDDPLLGGPAGLEPGDQWCLCAARWVEAYQAGAAPRVVLEATHAKTLEFVPLELLMEFATSSEKH